MAVDPAIQLDVLAIEDPLQDHLSGVVTFGDDAFEFLVAVQDKQCADIAF